MSFSKLWVHLSNLNTEPTNGHQLTLKVLYSKRNQPLLIPLDSPQAHNAVNFFIQNRILKYWGHLLIKLDHHLPELQLLPIAVFDSFPFNALFSLSDLERAKELPRELSTKLQGIAIFCGSPGALQKITIYCPSLLGGLGKVAKIAVHATANEAVKKESLWLEKLNHSTETAKFLPQLLQHSMLKCERYCLTMMSLPDGNSPNSFSVAHHTFLRVLAQQNPVFTEWKDSEAHIRLKQRISNLSALIDAEVWLFWQEIITEIERMTAQSVLPNLMIHGDFAHWNLKQINTDLLVFDWEYAETHGNPLQDFLHFHLIPQALGRSSLNKKSMAALLEKTVTYVDKQFGRDIGIDKACGALTLHYLLDTITFYAEASGYLDDKHPVLYGYTQMLKQRNQWLHEITAQSTTKVLEIHSYDNELEVT
jgi:hypothetical protein